MKKIILLIILAFLLFSVSGVLAVDIPYNTNMVYNVTLNKVEIYNSTTNQWVTVANTPLTFNIASADAGAVVGNYISGVTPPDGTYTQLRWTVSNQFGIKACDDGGTNCTSGQQAMAPHVFATAEAANYAAAVTVTTTVDFPDTGVPACPATPQCYAADDSLVGTENIGSLIVGPGSQPQTAVISFDVNNVFQWEDDPDGGGALTDYITPGQPGVSISFE